MKKIINLSLMSIAFLIGHSAFAADVTATPKATATLQKSCNISTNNVVFGNYDPKATEHQTSSLNVDIRCTKGTSWRLYAYTTFYYISGYTSAVSAMSLGSEKLYYQMQNSNGVWDNDIDLPSTPNNGHYLGVATGDNQSVVVPFRVLKNQYVPPGNYKENNANAYLEF